jgi:transcriptional regulator GlxA family with amidase domain
MKIRILVFDGVDEIDFVGPYQVFQRAAKLQSGIDVALVTLQPQLEVTASHGLRLHSDGVLEGAVDLLLVPGGGYITQAAHGVYAEIAHGELPRKIAALHATGTIVAGVCTGTMALSAAGLLDGRPAVTHHGALDDLRSASAQIIKARVVDDGDIITCGGVTASLDLALWVVERFWGAQTAEVIAGFLEFARSKDIYVSNKVSARTA